MNILKQVLLVIGFAVIALGLYYGLKVGILNKIKLKKRHLIIAFLIVLVTPFLILVFNRSVPPAWVSSVQMVLITIIFLIYLDIRTKEKIERNKPVIGRPKPKPNRIKK